MPAALAADAGDEQNGAEQRQLEQRERPFPLDRHQRQIGRATDDGEGREQEVHHHATAIGIRQIGGEAIGPGEAAQHLGLDAADESGIAAGKRPGAGQQRRCRAAGDGIGRFIGLAQAGQGPPAAEHGLDAAIGMEAPAALGMPLLGVEARGTIIGIASRRAGEAGDERLHIGLGLGGAGAEQRLGRAQDTPAGWGPGVDPQHRRALLQRGRHGVASAADSTGGDAIPDGDDEIRLLDHDAASRRHPLRGQCREGGCRNSITGRGEHGGEHGSQRPVLLSHLEPADPAGQPAHGCGARLDNGAGSGPAREQRLCIGGALRMGIDGDVEREAEGQWRRHLPAALQRLLQRHEIRAMGEQRVQPGAGGTRADRRLDEREDARQSRANGRLVGLENRIALPMAGNAQAQARRRKRQGGERAEAGGHGPS